ncbi:MAG: hypothetical protein ABSC56_04915 [Solirubrobacteraceae bacterium]|jgi:hypothetical protein
MKHQAVPAGGEPGKEYVFPNLDAVTEDNWQELVAQGVTVLDPCIEDEPLFKASLTLLQSTWGTGNVLTGDAFDEEEQRPLRLKPGRGIYVRREGQAYHDEFRRRWREHDREQERKASRTSPS